MLVKKLFGLILLLSALCYTLSAQEPEEDPLFESFFSLKLTPSVSIPLKGYSGIFKTGGGGDLALRYKFPLLPFVHADGTLGYTYLALQEGVSASLLSGSAGGGVLFDLKENLSLAVTAGIGGFYTFNNDNPASRGAGFMALGGVDLSYAFNQVLEAGIKVDYRNCFGFYDDVNIALAGKVNILQAVNNALEDSDFDLRPLYPLLYRYYNQNPFGGIIVFNGDREPVTVTAVNVAIADFMSNSHRTEVSLLVPPGETREIGLSAEFQESLLGNKKSRELDLRVVVHYIYKERNFRQTFKRKLVLENDNLIPWQEPSLMGVFSSPDNPVIKEFAFRVKKAISSDSLGELNSNLLAGIGIYNALALSGLSFREEREAPFSALKAGPGVLNRISFPVETLVQRAGDTDDLLLLYGSIFEALGIPTAFLFLPDSCLLAFSTDLSPEEASVVFASDDFLIDFEEKTWIPLDVSVTGKDFFTAVQAGMEAWKQADKKEFFPLSHVFEKFPKPDLAFVKPSAPPVLPEEGAILESFLAEQNKFLNWDLAPRIAALEKKIEASGGDKRLVNKLGVLYAKYELYDPAMALFYKLTLNEDYVPALMNMGNVYYLKGEMKKALPYYNRAYEKASIDPMVILCVARVNHSLENYGTARDAYNKLRSIDSELAGRFAYLEYIGAEAAALAGSSGVKDLVIWEEE